MSARAELTTTSYALLAFLHAGPKSGYDIKQLADRSTRFFWQISYGQIYPELKRLQDAGLVDVRADARGGRARHQYSLSSAGAEALGAWIDDVETSRAFELRDELLLKLFFANAGSPDSERRLAEQLERREEATLAAFDALKEHALEHASRYHGASPKLRVLDIGIQLHQAYLDAVRRLRANLS